MEKLIIGNTEFDLVPMGISEDAQRKTRSFKVVKSMEFDPMLLIIREGLEKKITHIGNDGQPAAVYSDCISLKRMAAEYGTEIDGEPQDTYLIELSTDASIGEMRALQSAMTIQQAMSDTAVAEITILIASMIKEEEIA
ncbi:hypothetical protein [Clostridium sp. KNHs205]|uniref:hypothetical protein n=1 Tax=Clostridium sp. KNHs205 TaxID=1449050 RepID=UPI00051AD9AD|nr:hypothetical protein [Clostridium sp. KNHs205]